MICTSISGKNLAQIYEVLARPEVEMAEIRIDLCELSDDDIRELFGESDTPLVATCRGNADRLALAVEAGARYADLELEAPASASRHIQKLCRRCGTELIRSYHDYEATPDMEMLQMALARCFRYGADIAKVVTMCNSAEDAARLESLYSVVLEGVDSLEGRLVAFGMGEFGKASRLECLRRSAPFTYAALSDEEATAPGQWALEAMRKAVYGDFRGFHASGIPMPASKSFAQRAIIAAALAQGTSHLGGYSPCADSEAAIALARTLGAKVEKSADMLAITGIGPVREPLHLKSVCVGESGLLARLSIPLLSALNGEPFTVDGVGTLLKRPLGEAGGIMASFGVLLGNAVEKSGARELYVPVSAKGQLIPGTAEVSGKGGSQLISGLLMALPLCNKDSLMLVSEPRSIPYMYITLDVLRHFGVNTRSEMEGDAEMLEAQDWTCCTGVNFKVKGGQTYHAADFAIESDWSAAANFLVAGALFGSVEVSGLDMRSLQADLAIVDILVETGAVVSQMEDGTVAVKRAPLEAFSTDLNHAPDLFPIVSVLAAFCAGESRISGIGRLAVKESNRAEAIVGMLTQMGVECAVEGDELVVEGEPLTSRILHGRMLKGGSYTTHHDHRMVMALKVASIGAESPIVLDDEACVSKSFPGFPDLTALA